MNEANQIVESKDSDILKNIVGDELYQKISYEFGGDYIYIPKPRKICKNEIYVDFENGDDFRVIARRYDYTVKYVEKIYRDYLRAKRGVRKETQRELF